MESLIFLFFCFYFLLFTKGMVMEGEETILQCPQGSYVSFTFGKYFHDEYAADVTQTLKINCCNERSCLINATNSWLGIDPHVGYRKTLDWNMVCEDAIGMCRNTPCVNGLCHNHCVSYTCTCFQGFTGNNCENDINECESSPCSHGTCVDAINNFTCTCHAGYTGLLCKTDIDECRISPCIHGTCTDAINNFTCLCEAGYSGNLCEKDIDECSISPCVHGTCMDAINNFTCLCEAGYNGNLCEKDINECESSQCSHGSCVDAINNFTCTCYAGYTGPLCETEIEECVSNPCIHGTCEDHINGFTCRCDVLYTGLVCQEVRTFVVFGALLLVIGIISTSGIFVYVRFFRNSKTIDDDNDFLSFADVPLGQARRIYIPKGKIQILKRS